MNTAEKTQRRIKKLEEILISRTKEAIKTRDSLAEAGYHLLQANISDDVKKRISALQEVM